MARPLSIDLRERAVAAVLQGGLSRLRAGRTNESAPKAGALPKFNRPCLRQRPWSA
jgi:hypothetical protein